MFSEGRAIFFFPFFFDLFFLWGWGEGGLGGDSKGSSNKIEENLNIAQKLAFIVKEFLWKLVHQLRFEFGSPYSYIEDGVLHG